MASASPAAQSRPVPQDHMTPGPRQSEGAAQPVRVGVESTTSACMSPTPLPARAAPSTQNWLQRLREGAAQSAITIVMLGENHLTSLDPYVAFSKGCTWRREEGACCLRPPLALNSPDFFPASSPGGGTPFLPLLIW